MMKGFVGRRDLLERLEREWQAVREDGAGRMVTIRGRRRVGKTWLVEELLDRLGAPHVFFAASRQTPGREVALFAQALVASTLPARESGRDVTFATWQAALVLASHGSERAHPSVLVLDEFPYLLGDKVVQRDAVLGAVQAAWDRTVSKEPVLLILVGSDQAMMELITAPRQPLHQRPSRELVVPPLNPAEVSALTGLSGADALEAYLVTGGYPKVARERMGRSFDDFLRDQLTDDGTPLVTTGRLILDAEFGGNNQSRSILAVLGDGLRKRADISRDTGIDGANLKRPLDFLVDEKRVVEARRPLSTASSRDTRYGIVDPYLRFYMRFVERYRGEIERGRGRVAAPLIMRDWPTYAGKAIEPVVRSALDELLPDARFGDAQATGAFWADGDRGNRKSVEVDLVGAERRDPPAKRIAFIGSVKWRQRARMQRADHTSLVAAASSIPGVEVRSVRTVAVSRLGSDPAASAAFDVSLDADDVVGAWASG